MGKNKNKIIDLSEKKEREKEKNMYIQVQRIADGYKEICEGMHNILHLGPGDLYPKYMKLLKQLRLFGRLVNSLAEPFYEDISKKEK